MPENEWRSVDRRARLCLIIGSAGVVIILFGAYWFAWRPGITLPAMALLGAGPLVAAAWMFLLANRRLDDQLRQIRKEGDVGRLAGDVAHDFNNLLAGILGAAEMLKTRLGQAGVEREMVSTIIAAARRAGQLSSKLMVAAKNDAGSAVPFDLQAAGREVGTVVIAEAQAGSEPARGRGLILLVDDEETILALASMVLVQLGYEVILASCGRKGIELYEKEHGRILAVVLDMVMPDMNGLDVLLELKRIDPQVKVAIAAGYIPDKSRADLQAAGVAAIIQKPYGMDEIGNLLAGMLGTEK
ncbi:MAG: response regulator [Tepidisphaerales bacterium]